MVTYPRHPFVAFLSVLVALATSAPALAATLLTQDGQLIGAIGVEVGGEFYDVAFIDGTCIDLYDGCDLPSGDFAFSSEAEAVNASQALLDQVFLDGPSGQFDSTPPQTAGCSDVGFCFAATPYALASNLGTPWVWLAAAKNEPTSDSVSFLQIPSGGPVQVGYDPTLAVYAVWSPVPEPSQALLLGLGLAALSRRSRS